MSTAETAAGFAITLAKQRGRAEVGAEELLLGALQAAGRFGVAEVGDAVIDLAEFGVEWETLPAKSLAKVGYSGEVVGLLDRAAAIARADAAEAIGVEHVLAAFANRDEGLMGELKVRHGFTSVSWRAALGRLPREPRTVGKPEARGERAQRDYLTPEEAAETLGVHVQTLRGYVRSGKLPALRLAGERALRIRRSDLETVLEPLQESA
jgi:excisionase family DNA binding protein